MINSYKNIIAICLCIFANILWAQTATTTASGLWGTASNWSRGTLPTSSSNALIDRAMTLSGTAITITASSTSYVYTINGVLNTPSGNTSSVYLNSGNVSGTATIDFRQDGTFRCTSSCASGTNAVTIGSTAGGSGGNPVNNLIIRSGATVYVFGDVEFNQNSSVLIEPGGALIVNGNITNKNNSDNITVNGILSVSGLASNNSNGIIVGSGSISAGSFNNGGGGATIFGSSTVCGSNCSMSTPIANCTSTTSTIAASQSICSVATPSALTASVTVPSTGSGYFFQWQVFTNSGWSGAPGTNGSITTVSSTSLISTYQPTTITASRAFRLLVTFTGCTSQLSNQITLSIGNFAASGTGTVSGSSSICSGTNSNYSVSGFVSATAYNWTVPTGVTIIAGAGTSSIVVTSTGSSTGLISVTGYNSCVSTPTSAASINVTLTSGVSGTGTINGSASQCQGTSTNYTVTGLSNVTTYNWTVPSGFTITSGSGTSIIGVSFTGAAASGDISISGNNTCGNGNRSKLTVTISPTVSGTGTINGSAAQCQGTSTNYTVTGLSNVTTYNWTVPSGFSITSGTGTSIIGVSFSGTAASGDISISGNNTCGNGNRSKLTVTITPTVSGTGTINGSASQCQGTSTNYTITGLTNVTTFNWTVPSGFSITSGTGTSIIGVSFSGTAASGDISISGNNTCGNGSTSKLTVTITPTVSGTALYAGTTSFCTSSTRNYTVSGISNFSSLTWSVPIGFTISSGQGTSIVGITSNSNVGGTVTLTAINTCGNYISTNLTLTYTSGSWLGITSDWNNSSNWCSGTVPISSSDVIISPTVSFMPVISSTGAIVNNLSIVGTGTISLNSGLTLSISGNFINSGTFNAASGSTVLFNGVGNQSISGSNTFSNLSISKSSTTVGVLLAANQSITGTLTLGNNSKIVTTGFSLTLVSNTTTTGRLAQVPSSAAY
ncbi:MAG: hypothetical protein SFY32_01775, partial [Bacteroidota bacterium]|nr:hypothetical protein [Bacteroidota bacterium]